MTSIITNEIEERYPYPDNGEAALAVYTGTSGMGFEEVEPLWSKLNPDAKEQYRRLARLAITAARTEALK